ncbi:MAG: SRPBCC domain-containing protein [Alphaproteobacteria bacterium]|nr:SRPBCC domain-containing protein [Alphaproteobacteria bacterium]
MSLDFSVSDVIPATPQAIYDAWLDSKGHAGITGGQPATCSAVVGGAFTVWNGFITGRNLALEPGKRIVQSWRTTRFVESDPDSEIEVLLEPVPGGTRITVNHRSVPDGHTSYRDGGWQRSYFDPMKKYLGPKPRPKRLAQPKRKTKTATKGRGRKVARRATRRKRRRS